MLRTWITLGAAALAMMIGLTMPVQADETRLMTNVMEDEEKLPAADALKIVAGTADGHKSPTEVLTAGIKAAKDGKMDVLKTCFNKDSQEALDYDSYYKDKQAKNIDIIAMHLATFDPAKLTELAQNTCGKYAVVMTQTAAGTHLIRAIWHTKNWYLKDTSGEDFIRDYNAGLKELREAVDSVSGEKLKDRLDQYETDALDLLVGVQDGVDPYDLLAKRLKKITTSEAKPRVFLSTWGWELAMWFSNPKAGEKESKDNFLVVKFVQEYDYKKNESFTVAKVALNSTAQFHKRPGNKFKEWTWDWDYYYVAEESDGK